MRIRYRSFAITLAMSMVVACPAALSAQVMSGYSLRESRVVSGSFSVTGNGLYDCASSGSCINNNGPMALVDADSETLGDLNGDGTDDTTVSSGATLTVPEDATIEKALLYVRMYGTPSMTIFEGTWAPTEASMWPVLFAPPGESYQAISQADGVVLDNAGTGGFAYYDVTSLIRGTGMYFVANTLVTPKGAQYNQLGYWTLVVIYDDGGAPKLVNLYDGNVVCNDQAVTNIEVSGFLTPAVEDVSAIFTTWSGDGAPSQSGDYVAVGGTNLSNSENPVNNVGNGTVSDPQGAIVREPMVFRVGEPTDIDTFDASAAFSGSQTETTITYTCGPNDGVWYTGAVLAFDVYVPTVSATKSVMDVDGNEALGGDTLRYEISVTVDGGDVATNVTIADAIPANTSFVEGSLRIGSGEEARTLSDEVGDDEAEYSNGVVTFRVGAGANGTTGGSIAVGETVEVSFDVKIDPIEAEAQISNVGVVSFFGASSGTGTVPITVSTVDIATGGATEILARPCPGVFTNGICGPDVEPDAGVPSLDAGGMHVEADSGEPILMTDTEKSGCDCSLARTDRASSMAWAGTFSLALLMVVRVRRRTRKSR